jgi:hypothetical protein
MIFNSMLQFRILQRRLPSEALSVQAPMRCVYHAYGDSGPESDVLGRTCMT